MISTCSSLIRRCRPCRDRRQGELLYPSARGSGSCSYVVIHLPSAGRSLSGGTELLVEQRSEGCSGALVFLGTRIPVKHIVTLLRRGIPASEIVEDYPALSDVALAYARNLAYQSRWRLFRPGPLRLLVLLSLQRL